jgi:hypothetical protein
MAGHPNPNWMKVGSELVDDLLYDPHGVLREVAFQRPSEVGSFTPPTKL